MTSPICLWRTLWRYLRHGVSVSGCDYEEEGPEQAAYVHVLKCRCCGSYSIGWRHR